MTPKRAEPYLVALQSLRGRLRQGACPVERRLAATEIAAELQLSPTPVREALARLAGEGLVEDRRGQGYFVRRLSALDVADLYRLSLAQLLIALEPRDLRVPAPAAEAPPGLGEGCEDPIAAVVRVERLFEDWVRGSGGRALLEAHRRVQARLAPVRRHEPLLIADLAEEASALAALGADEQDLARRAAAVRAFHRRRVRLAARLAAVLESRPPAPAIEPI